jgi:hypothetical protein
MNELSAVDKALLQSLKTRIEQLSGLPGNADLSQKDFDFLLYYIQEKTGQALSLTTLKRIWRNEYQRLPHLSTLNMLSQLAYNIDWHTAKKQFLETKSDSYLRSASTILSPKIRSVFSRWVLTISGVLVVIAGSSWYYLASNSMGDFTNIQFSAEPTTDLMIPNSVVFSYDVSGIRADHFYIQQSWDPTKMVEVLPGNKKQTDIYYEPGYHYAKLLGNERVLKEIPVHIKCNDWYVRFRYSNSELVRVCNADLDTAGQLSLKADYVLERFKPLDAKFQLGYMLSKDFNLRADELQLEAAIRFDSLFAPPCPMVNLLIKGDKDYAWITLGNKGCESNLSIRVSDLYLSGKTNDLSSMGIDVFSWQRINVTLSNGTFKLWVDGRVAQEATYSKTLGDLKEIDVFFNGIGSISNVTIGDSEGSLASAH